MNKRKQALMNVIKHVNPIYGKDLSKQYSEVMKDAAKIEEIFEAFEIIRRVLRKKHKRVEIDNWEILKYISKEELKLLKKVLFYA